MTKSQSILGKEAYWSIHKMAKDSIANWSLHELGKYVYFGNTTDYQLDSVFCVNESGDKILFSLLRRNLNEKSVGDGISYFYGVKIRNIWYFFKGPYLVLPREFYQSDIHTPLSFEKLKQIAASNIYRHYLRRNRQGEWEVNDDFFRDFTSAAWSSYWETNTPEQWDAIYLEQVNRNWRR